MSSITGRCTLGSSVGADSSAASIPPGAENMRVKWKLARFLSDWVWDD